MGNPVFNVGKHYGINLMKKVVAAVGTAGVLGSISAYFIGKAKGRQEMINEMNDDPNDEFNDNIDDKSIQ